MRPTSWLTALRLARREARRARGRSALVVAMIALPVLALSFAAVSYDMFRLTPGEQATRTLGAADAKINWVATGPVRQPGAEDGWTSDSEPRRDAVRAADLLTVLPPGSKVTPVREGIVELSTASGVGEIKAYGLDVADPMTAGLVTLQQGRVPAGDREVALTEQASQRLGARVGDVVRDADRKASWTVTGIVEFADRLNEKVVFSPDWVPSGANVGQDKLNQWLWDAPAAVDPAQVRRLNEQGLLVVSRTMLTQPSATAEVQDGVDAPVTFSGGLIVVGLAVLEVVLLAGPAFAVGARRRRRELGLIAANGGTPAHLRRIVLADGVVLGGLSALAGLVLGLVAAFALRPLVEVHLTQERAGGYRVFPSALAAIACLAVGTGVLAALVPAFTAARGDVVAALTGRRGVRRSRKRWLAVGLALTGAGAAATAAGAWWVLSHLVLAGLVLVEVGLVLCTPTLIGLVGRLGQALPPVPRIALRDAARNRAAAASAIAAVMAAVAGSVAIGVVRTTDQAREDAGYQQMLPLGHVRVSYEPVYGPGVDPKTRPPVPAERLITAVRDTLPATGIATVGQVGCPADVPDVSKHCGLRARIPQERRCPYDTYGAEALTRAQQRAANRDSRCGPAGPAGASLVVAAEAVQPLIGSSGDDLARARETLAAGGVLVDDARYVVDDKVTLMIHDADTDSRGSTAEMEARMRTITVPGYALTNHRWQLGVVVSPGAVHAAALGQRPYGLAVATHRMPTQAEQDRLTAVLRDLDKVALIPYVERGKPDSRGDPTLLVLAIVAGFITLGAAGIGTGLAASDGRADLTTLAAVGASPGVRRRLSLSQAGTIAGLGTVLGTIAGLGASTAVLFGYNQSNLRHWPPYPEYPITVPWETLAVVLAVPLAAMLATGLLTRSRLPIERRRLT
jgi:putative ABC transport system permease protein